MVTTGSKRRRVLIVSHRLKLHAPPRAAAGREYPRPEGANSVPNKVGLSDRFRRGLSGVLTFQVVVAFAVFRRKRQDLAAQLGPKPFERLHRGGDGMRLVSGVAWVVILPQQTRELVPIEPAPAYRQTGEKFEFAVCQYRHRNTSWNAQSFRFNNSSFLCARLTGGVSRQAPPSARHRRCRETRCLRARSLQRASDP